MNAYDLPIPPSTNQLFRNVKGKGRVRTERYNTWINAAGWELKAQKPKPVTGPVSLTIAVNEKKTRADLGNLEKAAVDLLVAHGVIEDDKPSIVRSIHLYWCAHTDRCSVAVAPVPALEAAE